MTDTIMKHAFGFPLLQKFNLGSARVLTHLVGTKLKRRWRGKTVAQPEMRTPSQPAPAPRPAPVSPLSVEAVNSPQFAERLLAGFQAAVERDVRDHLQAGVPVHRLVAGQLLTVPAAARSSRSRP